MWVYLITFWVADALDANAVEKAMEGQDTLLCSLEGDVLTMAKNIDRAGIAKCMYDRIQDETLGITN